MRLDIITAIEILEGHMEDADQPGVEARMQVGQALAYLHSRLDRTGPVEAFIEALKRDDPASRYEGCCQALKLIQRRAFGLFPKKIKRRAWRTD